MTDTQQPPRNEPRSEGWNWLSNSRKWHYFRDGRSLCQQYMLLGSNADAQTGNDMSPDNCAACRRVLLREIKQAELEERS